MGLFSDQAVADTSGSSISQDFTIQTILKAGSYNTGGPGFQWDQRNSIPRVSSQCQCFIWPEDPEFFLPLHQFHRCGYIRVGQEDQVSQDHVQAASQGCEDQDLLHFHFLGIQDGQFKIGLVFILRMNQHLHPQFIPGLRQIRIDRIQIPDENVREELEIRTMPAAAICRDHKIIYKKGATRTDYRAAATAAGLDMTDYKTQGDPTYAIKLAPSPFEADDV